MQEQSKAEQFRNCLLDAVRDEPMCRLRILARLAEWGGQTVYLPVVSEAECRVVAARKMLSGGMTCPEAADALRKRFGCSLRTAQRDVKTAKNLS